MSIPTDILQRLARIDPTNDYFIFKFISGSNFELG